MTAARASLLGALLALALAGCGPRPAVESAILLPGERPRAEIDLRNDGGAGQVALRITLTDRRTGAVVGRASEDVEMEAGERLSISVALDRAYAPRRPGEAPPRLSVEATYPAE